MNTPEVAALRYELSRNTSFKTLVCFFAIAIISSKALLIELNGTTSLITSLAPLASISLLIIVWFIHKRNKLKMQAVNTLLDSKKEMTAKTLQDCLAAQSKTDEAYRRNVIFNSIASGIALLISLIMIHDGHEVIAFLAGVLIAIYIICFHDLVTCKNIASKTRDALNSIYASKSSKDH